MGLRDLSIRKFRTEDAKAVAKIINDNLAAANSDNNIEITPRLVLTLSNKRKMYVAVIDNVVIGTASIDFDTITNVFTDTEYRNQGTEEALIRLLEEIAANNGLKLIKLESCVAAEKLYEGLGYSSTDTEASNELGKVTVMERYLF